MRSNNALLILVVLPFFALSQNVFTDSNLIFDLKKSVQYALENNFDSKNAQLNQVIAKKMWLKNKTTLFPEINASGNYRNYDKLPVVDYNAVPQLQGDKHQLDLDLSFSQVIFSPLNLKNSIISNQEYKIKTLHWEKSKIEIIADVKQSFYLLLLSQESIKFLELNIKRLEKTVADFKLRANNGLLQQIDVDRVQLLLNKAETAYKKKLREIPYQKKVLLFYMNMDIYADVNFIGDLKEILTGEDLEIGANHLDKNERIEEKIAAAELKLAQKNLLWSKINYLPEIQLVGTYKAAYMHVNFDQLTQRVFPESYWGFKLSLPLFSSLKKTHELKIHHLELSSAQNNFEKTRAEMTLFFEKAKAKFLNSLDDLNNEKANISLAELIFQSINYQHANGLKSVLDVLDAQKNLADAENNYLEALHELLLSKIELDKSLGQLK